jgi:membrane-bound serine protease (ClpP class)
VIDVSGRIDPVLADFVSTSIHNAQREKSTVLVLRLNSAGALVSESRLRRLRTQIEASTVPVATWVGPNGAVARGGARDLMAGSRIVGVAPGAHVESNRQPPGVLRSPTLGQFVNDLDGLYDIHLPTKIVHVKGRPQREPLYVVAFSKPSLLPRLMHTAASPSVAFLLFVIGLLLIIFEFFRVGVGVAEATGAGALVLSA